VTAQATPKQPVKARRVAIVLFNLGGPDGQAAVRPFLFNLFRDPAIIRLPTPARLALAALIAVARTRMAKANYALMGGGSPLLPETRKQAEALQQRLDAMAPETESRIFIAMRYWKPFTAEAARAVAAFAPDEIVLLPLYPQYSTTTTASSLDAWKAAYRGPGRTHTVCCYPDVAGLAKAHAEHARATWDAAGRPSGLRLLFSAHGLPQRVVDDGDPYAMQVEKTCRAILDELGPLGLGDDWDWKLCYQSRVGRLKWLEPSTTDALAEAAELGRGVLVIPVAFVSEHVETLVELDIEYAELAHDLGIEPYLRAPAVGVQADFIDALANIAIDALQKDGAAPAGSRCGDGRSGCECRKDKTIQGDKTA
jgi:ferrochelatase